MTDDICGAPLDYGDGTCDNRASYPDGKCGVHSDENDTRWTGRPIEEPLINEFLERERHTNPRTFDTRKSGLRKFDLWLEETDTDLMEIGPLSIEDYIAWLTSDRGQGLADGTASKYLDQVSKLYQYLEKKEKQEYGENDLFDENPAREADVSLNTDYSEMSKQLHDDDGYVAISPDEFEELMGNVQPPTVRNELLFQLMWDTGLRPIEVNNIRLSDIDHEIREIAIRSEKTHLNRTVFYGQKVATLMNIWLNGGERDRFLPADSSEYLFISHESEQITTRTIQTAFREAAKAADLHGDPVYYDAREYPQYDLHPYSLRHGYAERMIQKPGIDIEMVRDAMGHKTVNTTQKYMNPDKETRRTQIQTALDG